MALKINKNIVSIASDHAGYLMKEYLINSLQQEIIFCDLGTNNANDSVDYPYYAQLLAKDLYIQGNFGILICNTGIGMSIAANRHHHIRAALCNDLDNTRLARHHNDANVLVLSSKCIPIIAVEIVRTFIITLFSNEDRHIRRINNLKC